MRICLLNDSFPPVIDGVANTVVNYASDLQSRDNIEVAVGTPFYPDTDYSIYPYPVITYPSLNTTALTSGYRAGYPFPVKQIGEMAMFIPDIIHTHCPIASTFIARSLRSATGAPIILTYHTKYDIDIRRTVPGRLLQDESIKALVQNVSACDEVWTVSHGAGENLKSLGYQGEWKVVPNGVDFQKGLVPEPEVREAVKDYDLPADIPVFLFVGRMMNYKGLPLIIEALRNLAETHDFRMVFIGRGADEASLKKSASDAGFTVDERLSDGTVHTIPGENKNGRIIFTGSISDRNILRAWNTRADLFLFPSTFDTNGLVVREAAACGLASVLVIGSCAAEGITDGRNGFLIEENAESMAALLEHACTHLSEIREAGQKAMDEIYLSWHDAISLAEKLYGDVLERKKSGLLKEHNPMDEEAVFRITADAARLYAAAADDDLPLFDGMLDNLHDLRIQAENDFRERLEQTKKEAEDTLHQLLKK